MSNFTENGGCEQGLLTNKLSLEDGNSSTVQTAQYFAWGDLVRGIEQNLPAALERLYNLFQGGIRATICSHLGPQNQDDGVQEIFLQVAKAIQRGHLREPERLMGLVRTITRRQISGRIEGLVRGRKLEATFDCAFSMPDKQPDPEQRLACQQEIDVMKCVLRELSERDRDILTRFYLREETEEEICVRMTLSRTAFRLLKSRAKAKFAELGKRKLRQRILHADLARSSALNPHPVWVIPLPSH